MKAIVMTFKVNKDGNMGGFWGRKNKGQMYYQVKKNSVILFLSTLEIKNIYLYYKSVYMPFNCSENSFFSFCIKRKHYKMVTNVSFS